MKLVPIRGSEWSSGSDKLVATKTAELREFASERKLETVGEPMSAFYNPPWALPFVRRNEIMLELASH